MRSVSVKDVGRYQTGSMSMRASVPVSDARLASGASMELAATAPLGAAHTVVVVGAGREAVEAHLADVAPSARAVVQAEQNGSGHAAAVALAAVPDLEGTVLLLNGDAPLLRPGGSLDAWWRARRFDLDDYAFSNGAGTPQHAGAHTT